MIVAALLLVAFLAGVLIGPLYTAVYARQQQQHRPGPSGAGGEHS